MMLVSFYMLFWYQYIFFGKVFDQNIWQEFGEEMFILAYSFYNLFTSIYHTSDFKYFLLSSSIYVFFFFQVFLIVLGVGIL
jgi:hypothetical protein